MRRSFSAAGSGVGKMAWTLFQDKQKQLADLSSRAQNTKFYFIYLRNFVEEAKLTYKAIFAPGIYILVHFLSLDYCTYPANTLTIHYYIM